MKQSKPSNSFEIVAATLLAVVFLGSVFVTLLLVGSETPLLPCMAPGIGSLLGALMLALRDRTKPVSVMTILASVVLAVLGVSWAGLAGIYEVIDGLAIGFCLTPGALLTLLGLGTYWYETRRRVYGEAVGEETAVSSTTSPQAAAESATGSSTIQGYQAQLARAGIYREQIAKLIKSYGGTPFASQFESLAAEFTDWHGQVDTLVQRLVAFEQDKITQADRVSVPAAIANLEAQLAQEADPVLRQEMEDTLAGYRQHEAQLSSLTSLMRRTELDVEEIIAAMGTIYSQLQVLQATDIGSDRAQRLSHDLEEQVLRLNDLLTAVEDVYTRDLGHS
ncbi:MAG: hypothetical protein H6658_10550 [Ardenticatenaceae bacterium]|nr:hypothetical protein [Ardenticatenaceae bacterium]